MKTKIIIAITLLLIVVLGAGYQLDQSKKKLNFSCVSTFQLPKVASHYSISGRTIFVFHPDGNGSITIDGKFDNVESLDTNTHLRRRINFDYVFKQNGEIEMSDISVIKHVTDDVSDKFFNNFLYDFSSTERVIKITKIKNAYLIGNDFSPVFMCINK